MVIQSLVCHSGVDDDDPHASVEVNKMDTDFSRNGVLLPTWLTNDIH